ncbi:MAG: HlyD family efflux transporter periplasmic adaptor subunit [Rhizobiales bacterium]|nr:HlyD family efflux transporter periplasmic adaptor subunit [Hyphomicrobiales bacterium]
MTLCLHSLLSPVPPTVCRTAYLFLALALAACSPSDNQTYQGYGEGEFVNIAPLESGPLDRLLVHRGETVAKDAELFRLEITNQQAQRDAAAANLVKAEANLADLEKGLRPTEIDQLEASLKAARAEAHLASLDFSRKQKLISKGNISQASLDNARATLFKANANVAQISAQLATGRLPSRSDQIDQAKANVKATRATLDQAEYSLSRRLGTSPADALVNDTYYKPGEMVSAGQPVVSLLPPDNIKVRFFVPETDLGAVAIGQKVSFHCDGCPTDLVGTVNYISPQAEYTPPVIYSEQSKSKLVYMVEAKPADRPEKIHPGQPVSVTLITHQSGE